MTGILISLAIMAFAVYALAYFMKPMVIANMAKNKVDGLELYSKMRMLLIAGGVLFVAGILSSSLIYVEKGQIVHVIYPTGKIRGVSKTGINVIMPFSRQSTWNQFVEIGSRFKTQEGEWNLPVKELEGVIQNGVPVRFIDQVTGDLYMSVRMEIPTDEPSFIAIANKYKTEQNLVQNTFIPILREQSINVAYMFSAENYVSGSATDFKLTLEDAFKNGGFVVRKEDIIDTTWSSSIAVPGQRTINEIKKLTRVVRVIDPSTGSPRRIRHEISDHNIIVSQVVIDDVVLEPTFRKKLEQQRDISANKRIEMQKVETAEATQKRIVAEGENAKTSERVRQETEQVKQLILIETKLKQETTNMNLAEIQLRTEQFKASAMKVQADAQSYQNAKLVAAGLGISPIS